MFYEVVEAIERIAKRHNMCMVHVFKWFNTTAIVKLVAEELDIEKWEYGKEIFDAIVAIARIAGIDKVGQIPMSDLEYINRLTKGL